MKAFKFTVQFNPSADFNAEMLKNAFRGHLAETNIPMLDFQCDGNSCTCIAQVVELPNGFPFRVMILSGLDRVFENMDCQLTCIPAEGMEFIEY